jgi:hypothetical protein
MAGRHSISSSGFIRWIFRQSGPSAYQTKSSAEIWSYVSKLVSFHLISSLVGFDHEEGGRNGHLVHLERTEDRDEGFILGGNHEDKISEPDSGASVSSPAASIEVQRCYMLRRRHEASADWGQENKEKPKGVRLPVLGPSRPGATDGLQGSAMQSVRSRGHVPAPSESRRRYQRPFGKLHPRQERREK